MLGSRSYRVLAANLIVGVAYFIAGKLGLQLAFDNQSATAVWPPTGIALAALLIFGYRVWPSILLAAFFTNLTTAGTVATSLGIAVGNTLEGLLGCWLVERYAGGLRVFESTQNLFKFAFIAVLPSTVVSATIGVTSLALGGFAQWPDFASIWLTWWTGDLTGDLVVAPWLLLWWMNPPLRLPGKKLVELFALLISLYLSARIVFGGILPDRYQNYPLEFLCVPILIWAALRFRQRKAATAVLLLSGLAIQGTLDGFGPFVRHTPNASLLLLQAYMSVISLTTLTLATSVLERRRAEAGRLKVIEELHQAVHNIKTLKGLLPICASCKKVRDDKGYWENLESYVRHHSDADFTHGICPACAEQLYPEEMRAIRQRRSE